MRLGSGEHYGWERPRTVRLMAVLDGPSSVEEFAWLQVPLGAKGGPLDVVVRPRSFATKWKRPRPGERIELQSWTLYPSQVTQLEAATDGPNRAVWDPVKQAPDQWLWVEG